VVTVCQHIYALKYSELFKQLGVTDLFWPHAEHNTRQLDGITIHPFPLYPAMTASLHEQEAGLPAQQRRYLFSFVGAHDPKYYRTASREWLAALPQSVRGHEAFLRLRREWHFQRAVYDVQVRGLSLTEEARQDMQEREREYLELLRQSAFSLCPSGSGPNTIRLWESLALGAIPVVLADGLRLPGDPMLWQEAAMFVRETPAAVAALPQMLAELHARPELLQAKRQAGASLYRQYGPSGFVPDVLALMQSPLPTQEQETQGLEQADQEAQADPAEAAMPDVVVLDPGLKDAKSHHHRINILLQERAKIQSLTLRVHGNHKARQEDFPYSVVPLFQAGIYEDTAELDAAAYQQQVLSHCQDLEQLLGGLRGSAVVVHTTTAAFLQGLALALQKRHDLTSVVIELMFHPWSFVKGGAMPPQSPARYITALRMLKRSERETGVPVHLSTSCLEFAKLYSAMLGEDVPVHPCALHAGGRLHTPAQVPVAQSGPPTVLLFAGDLKLDKGIHWVVDALPTVLQSHPGLQFAVHLGDNRFANPQLQNVVKTAQAHAGSHRNLQLLHGPLTDEAWDELLGRASICVIPYEPQAYAYKTSGIFWEFMNKRRAGAHLLLTQGTWMEREAAALGLPAATCRYGDTRGLSAALQLLTSQGMGTAAMAQDNAYRQAWNKCFGTGNDEFIFRLLAGGTS
jgi:glycosyltransferase involved in cell wall biosynthesis